MGLRTFASFVQQAPIALARVVPIVEVQLAIVLGAAVAVVMDRLLEMAQRPFVLIDGNGIPGQVIEYGIEKPGGVEGAPG